jgi:hypothetical protein
VSAEAELLKEVPLFHLLDDAERIFGVLAWTPRAVICERVEVDVFPLSGAEGGVCEENLLLYLRVDEGVQRLGTGDGVRGILVDPSARGAREGDVK